MELKAIEAWPKRSNTVVRFPTYKKRQRVFLGHLVANGVPVVVGLGVGRERFYIVGKDCPYVGMRWTRLELTRRAYWNMEHAMMVSRAGR